MTPFTKSINHLALTLGLACALLISSSLSVKSQTFSEGQLKSFATAATAINEIALKWQPKVQAAKSDDQAAEMLQQVDTEMRQAIESTEGIGVDEYQSIMVAAQSDPALKGQIETMLKDIAPK